MSTKFKILIFFLCLALWSAGQAKFVPNVGQWEGDFEYKTRLTYGALFFENDGMRVHIFNTSDLDAMYGEEAHHSNNHPKRNIRHHAYKMQWINTAKPILSGGQKQDFYRNYYTHKNPKFWQSNVPVYTKLNYKNIYEGIDIQFFEQDKQLKYNYIVHPHAEPKQIVWSYQGADSVWVQNNQIIISTSAGYITESFPAVYTKSNHAPVDAQIVLRANKLHIELGSYDKSDTLIIDPIIEFASFSGSLADNWGFTATYDHQGNLYGGGIAMNPGYPTTTGAFQSVHGNPTDSSQGFSIDCAISKFDAQGNNLLFSTYLGGNGQDQPHSMFADSLGNLYVFGVTGSDNFPVTANAFQDTFAGGFNINMNGYNFVEGSDIFIAKFNPSGTNLLASTYVGGTANDGLNTAIVENYSDQSRGEIVLGNDNQVYITASTLSADFPVKNASQSTLAGLQEAVIFKMDNNLSSMYWSTFYGGKYVDAGYGIKVGTNNAVYICGGTRSQDLPGTANGLNSSSLGGGHDGYVAKFNQTTGALEVSSYLGTNLYDQAFLIDLDKFNNVYIFGQTLGMYNITPNVYAVQGGRQFLHKLNSDLNTTQFSTALGKSGNKVDLVPTALNVDDCLNILMSGWGGATNGTNISNMPITPDAFQHTTDGSDFYFLVLAANADSLKFATYFGGLQSAEHVDGGTSRFDRHGNIYQAVCAGCGGNSDFPVTANAVSQINGSSNCNLGVVKINFETNILAQFELDSSSANFRDTTCYSLTVELRNNSKNANQYFWDFGNGKTSNAQNPTAIFDSLGVYTITLIAEDTLCDISDTATLEIIHDTGKFPEANFYPHYTSCDGTFEVQLLNYSENASEYTWYFGDGNTSTAPNPVHNYSAQNTYTITLVASYPNCPVVDSVQHQVEFTNDVLPPVVTIYPDSCFYGGLHVVYQNDSSTYTYEWNFNGFKDKHKFPVFRYKQGGIKNFELTITDTVCNISWFYTFEQEVQVIKERVYIPSAFTPNRDNINEEFIIAGNECLEETSFEIFNSYGNIVFSTQNPFKEFWNGYIDGKPAQEDVYVYVFKSKDFEKRGLITVFY